jgi:hypothetical protein
MTFPKIEDNIKELRGVIINKIIRNMDIPKHIHTFLVDLAYSIIGVFCKEVIKISLYFIFYTYI